MTIQAQNSSTLYKGQNPLMIKCALSIQEDSIVDELKKYFGVLDIDSLAIKLSIG